MIGSNPGATPPIDEQAYARAYPYYVEYCALSELRKKPGFGGEIASGVGGHCLLYLNGVRLDRAAGYPVLTLCPDGQVGTGISVNSHYRNANWVAFEGRDFLWRGALAPGEALTRAAYRRTQELAMAGGMLDGVEFHEHLFRDKPRGMSDLEYMYEISVATDYAVSFGRDAYRARVPLDAARMAAVVDYLNALNRPYRAGKIYTWRLFTDNCVHVARNALAEAGVLAPWPAGPFRLRALFKFPVPKNGFVDLMMRTNDLPLARPEKLFRDRALRLAFAKSGMLPAGPGGLAAAAPAMRDNEVYDTARLRLIFFDHPLVGAYQFRFNRIFAQPRYFDMQENLRYFDRLYGAVAARLQGDTEYAAYIAAMAAKVKLALQAENAGLKVMEPV